MFTYWYETVLMVSRCALEHPVAENMRLIVSRTGQEYNQRKGRKGAFWEDRHHATAMETDECLAR